VDVNLTTSYVPIGIEDKGYVPHLPVGKTFLERDVESLKPLAGLANVVNCNGDMSESSTRLRVSAGVSLEIGVVLSAVIVSKLQDACLRIVTANKLLGVNSEKP
jgi:hypothetical protein